MSRRGYIVLAACILGLGAIAVAPVIGAPVSVPASADRLDRWVPPAERARDASENVLRLMRRGDVKATYAVASPELKAAATVDRFREMVQTISRAGMKTVRWGEMRTDHKLFMFDEDKNLRWNVYTIEVDGILTTSGGETSLRFRWINNDGTWRLLGLRWDDAKKTP